jgi:hypothetical protein
MSVGPPELRNAIGQYALKQAEMCGEKLLFSSRNKLIDAAIEHITTLVNEHIERMRAIDAMRAPLMKRISELEDELFELEQRHHPGAGPR